jgi:hypothetical protein
MAHIFPNQIPADVSATKSERALFAALKNNLSDEYFVYCAMPFIAAEFAEQGEVDFIILHPKHGMLFLECKGGGVERDHDGTWYRRNGKRRERLSRSPAEQAKKQVEALVTKFRKPCTRLFGRVDGRFPMVYGWALAFPFTRWTPDEIPPDVEPPIFLDAEILSNTQTKIDEAFAFWHRGHVSPPRLENEQFETFRKAVLSPEIKLVPNLGGILQAERMEVVRLNHQQAAIAETFATGRRIMVDGGAGTGKTLLALHCAQRMASEDKRVLLLCSSGDLAQRFRTTTDRLARQVRTAGAETTTLRRPETLETTTAFYRPSEDAATQPLRLSDIEIATKAILKPDATATTIQFQRPDLVQEFHVKQLPGTVETFDVDELYLHAAALQSTNAVGPEALMGAVQNQRLGPWDAIIVDQATDFAPSVWEVLESSIAPGGQMAIFYDSSATQKPIPRLGPLVVLQRPHLATISQAILGLVSESTFQPMVIIEPDPERALEKLAELVREMIEGHGVGYHQVAILTPDTSTSLLDTTMLNGIPVVHDVSAWQAGVLRLPISRFKGLHADVVILFDCPADCGGVVAYRTFLDGSARCLRLYMFAAAQQLPPNL